MKMKLKSDGYKLVHVRGIKIVFIILEYSILDN